METTSRNSEANRARTKARREEIRKRAEEKGYALKNEKFSDRKPVVHDERWYRTQNWGDYICADLGIDLV